MKKGECKAPPHPIMRTLHPCRYRFVDRALEVVSCFPFNLKEFNQTLSACCLLSTTSPFHFTHPNKRNIRPTEQCFKVMTHEYADFVGQPFFVTCPNIMMSNLYAVCMTAIGLQRKWNSTKELQDMARGKFCSRSQTKKSCHEEDQKRIST